MLVHLTGVLLMNAWAAFSPAALLAGAGGLGLFALVALGSGWLPAIIRVPLLSLGLALIVGAAVHQAGTAKGAHDAFVVAAERARAAEATRADLAEADARAIGAQAAKDAEAHAADVQTIRDLTDVLAKRPDRDRIALPHDLARRLRVIRSGPH